MPLTELHEEAPERVAVAHPLRAGVSAARVRQHEAQDLLAHARGDVGGRLNRVSVWPAHGPRDFWKELTDALRELVGLAARAPRRVEDRVDGGHRERQRLGERASSEE